MKPLLAHVYEPHRVQYPCWVQPKLNGIRALYQNGSFQSRDELPFPNGLLDHLAAPLRELFGPDVILDGELYRHGWPLQRINAAVTPIRQQPTEDTGLVEYHVFDVADYHKSFEARYINRIDEAPEVQDEVVNFVRTAFVANQEVADDTYAYYVSLGYEGMMYRLGDCPYTVPKQPVLGGVNPLSRGLHRRFLSDKNNRCWHLLKRKDWQDDEFLCVDVVEGEGKLKGMLGAVICQTPSGSRFNVGSGLTDNERQHYWANPPIGRLVKVKYLVLSSDGIPLNPTILAIL